MKLKESILAFLKPRDLDEDLQLFELKMHQTLVPVPPNPKFVISLRQRLMKQFPSLDLQPARHQYQTLKTGLLVSGGIIGSLFVVLTGIRGFISIIGLIGLLINWYKRYSQESLSPSSLIQGS
jgi:hypothetical protein